MALNIKDFIDRLFRRGTDVINPNYGKFYIGDSYIGREEFAKVIFISITKLLTNLVNDVTFTLQRGEIDAFASFNAFVSLHGQFVLNRLFLDGYVVVGASEMGLRILAENEFQKIGTDKVLKAKANNPNIKECYVLRSPIYDLQCTSEYNFAHAWIKYLNNAMNASNTALERLGALVVASPKTPSNLPTVVTLSKEQKDAIEKEIGEEYGALSKQKQIMVLPREMAFQTINLATLDFKTSDRVKDAVKVICDLVGVPANQVAMIDADSSKSLSNGSELREGDFNKYQSFERLLNHTFVRMAEDMGLKVDYSIYNKPERQTTQVI